MIVRDEAHIVAEALRSAAPHIDYWVIVDTGSRDDTADVVRDQMAAHGIPGELHERVWRDFGANRTEALDLCAGKADYAWVLDADDLLVGSPDLSALHADSYLLRYGPDLGYWRKQLFRLGLPWSYVGVVHEYPVCAVTGTEERLLGDYHVQSRRLGARGGRPETYARDAELLRAVLQRDPEDRRAAFYLAQSLFDAGDPAGALQWYERRSQMGGWEEEVFWSLLRRAGCLTALGSPWERVLDALLQAWQARPTRAEPLFEIARHYRLTGQFHLAYLFAARARAIPRPEEDMLFVAEDVYAWRAADELAISAFHAGTREESLARCEALLADPALPAAERARIRGNRDLARAAHVDAPPRLEEGALGIAIYAGPAWERWSPQDIEQRGLGGSETAAVRLAEALADAGHAVEVYADVPGGEHAGVRYRPYAEFDAGASRDVVILSRTPRVLRTAINAAVTLLWMHDAQYGDELTAELAVRLDGVMVLSRWQHDHVLATYPFLAEKLILTRNGITPGPFTDPVDVPARDPHRALYSSSPARGLPFLLELWTRVRQRCPDATLDFCAPGIYDRVADADEDHAALRRQISALADQPGVRDRGALTQPQLAAAMRASGVWLAPSWSTIASARFHETFCIGAVEAAAAGLVRVMSDWGALSERDEGVSLHVPSGDDAPDPERWVDGIVDAFELASRRPPGPSARALAMTWDAVARDVLQAVEHALEAGPSSADTVPLLASLAPSAMIGEIALDVTPAWPVVDAAIASGTDGHRMIVRTQSPDEDGSADYAVTLDDGLGVTDVRVAEGRPRPEAFPATRGAVEIDEGRLFAISDGGDPAAQGHRFVLVEHDAGATRSSVAFVIAGGASERITGLSREGSRLLMSLTTDEPSAALVAVDLADVLLLLGAPLEVRAAR